MKSRYLILIAVGVQIALMFSITLALFAPGPVSNSLVAGWFLMAGSWKGANDESS